MGEIMIDDDLCYLTATDALDLYRQRKVSPSEVLQAHIQRAAVVEPRVNAFTEMYFDDAIKQAKLADDHYMRGTARPLEGLPVAVKDAQRMAGRRTTYGSLVLSDNRDDRSDPMIERLEQAGAIIHARTTTSEFCLSLICSTRLWGTTRNPFDQEFGTGGSSGGSAASLAAGTSILATGTDIGGSIRIPASCCGVLGYKPPKGRNPDGAPANFDPYNHCGPLGRSVADLALVQNVVAGPDPRDHSSLRELVTIPKTHPPIKGMRIGWSMDLGYMPISQEVRRNTLAALEVFRSLGCILEEVDLGWTADCDAAAQSWYNSMHFGRQALWHSKENGDLLTDYALAAARSASSLSPDDVSNSWTAQNLMYQSFGKAMERCDLFICPTTAIPALRADQEAVDDNFKVEGTVVDLEFGWILTHHFNMLYNCPVMSVPSGRAPNRIPTGIQLVGRTFDDLTVFQAAQAYETAVGGWFGPDSRPAIG